MDPPVSQSDVWLLTLQSQYGSYQRPPNAFGMTTDNELHLVETYARERYTGRGRIVDLGCWYGATTLSLARGLAANPHAGPHRGIDAFDVFVWEPWIDPFVEQLSMPRRYTHGEDFYPDVLELMRPHAGMVNLQRQDLLSFTPDPAPIEFLFVDAMKDWRLAERIVTGFFPSLIPGDSYVVQQDFAWHLPEMAITHIVSWRLRHALTFLQHVPRSAGVVFKCVKPIERGGLPPFTPETVTLEEIAEAHDYSRRCVSRDMTIMIDVAHLNFLVEQGHAGAALMQLQALGHRPQDLTEWMIRDVQQVADRAVAAGRLSGDARSELGSLLSRVAGGQAQWSVSTTPRTRTFNAGVALAAVLLLGFVAALFAIEFAWPTPTVPDVVAAGGTGAATPAAGPVTLDSIFRQGATLPWVLDLHDSGSRATLEAPAESPDRARVAIGAATVPTAFNVQLNLPGLPVTTGDRYELTFRIRSDSPRTVFYGVSMAHDPWANLGFYRRADVGPAWQAVKDTMTVTASDNNARLHFDLGESAIAVEIEAVSLRRVER